MSTPALERLTPGSITVDPEEEPLSLAPQLPRCIPSLDGLRAISIALVFIAHIGGTRNAPLFFDHAMNLGNLGVKVFFEISGFLITTILLRELSGTGRIRLTGFYARRSLRIFPAFYAYVGTVCLLVGLGIISLKLGDLFHALTFTMNYHDDRAWYLNHLWSLAAEEQFYLIWPLLIVFLGPRRALVVAATSLLLVPILRLAMWQYWGSSPTALPRRFQAVADALALGCMLAGCYNWLGVQRWYLALASSRLFPIVPATGLALGLASGGLGRGFYYVAGQSVANFAIVLGIDYCVRFPTSPLGRLLNTPPFVWVGILSYSLYLWQGLFLNPMDTTSSYTSFPSNVVLAILASVASYFVVERPFLKLKAALR